MQNRPTASLQKGGFLKEPPIKTFQKRHLIIFISVLLVVGFLGTTLASYYVSKNAMRDALIKRELPITSDNIYSEIQRDLLRPVFISSLMAQDTFFRDWIVNGEKNIHQITKYLREIKQTYNTFTSFFVSERSRIYYHANGILKKVQENEKRDVWYFRVRSMKEPYEINVDPDMANKDTATIFINYKVFDYRGNYIGATGVGLAVDSVRTLIENYRQRYNRNIFFINTEGSVLLKGSEMSKDISNIKNEPAYRDIFSKIISKKEGTHQFQQKSGAVLINSRFIPELKWYLIVEQAEDPSMGGIRETLYRNLIICLLITIVVVITTNYVVTFYQRKLETAASIDKLTGLLNRQAFELVCLQVLKEIHRNKIPATLVIFDIDNLKTINDNYGHIIGDLAISTIAKAVSANKRNSDVACRWGGDEFLILFRDCTVAQAQILAEKLRVVVAEKPVESDTIHFTVTITLGAAEYQFPETLDSILHRADQALYRAKQMGRNRTELAC